MPSLPTGTVSFLFTDIEGSTIARETFGVTMPRPPRGDHKRFKEASLEEQADPVFAAAWAEGRAMTLEQAIEYALRREDPRVQSDTMG
jgi:hypothetical protein